MTEQEFIRKLPAIDEYYVIMCDFTKQPYAECDPETFDDKAFIFFEEKPALDFVDDYKEDKMMLHVEKVARTSILAFLTTLIVEGINMVCFRGEEEHNIQIEHIVTRQLKEGVPTPVENPTLQISMIYFMQAVRTAETQEARVIAKQFEEEMMVNIARATYLVPSKAVGEADEEGNQKIAFYQVKNQNGDVFVPLFTDLNEFIKYQNMNKITEQTMQFMPLKFNQIYDVYRQGMTGFIINPATVAVLLNKQHLDAINERFGDEA